MTSSPDDMKFFKFTLAALAAVAVLSAPAASRSVTPVVSDAEMIHAQDAPAAIVGYAVDFSSWHLPSNSEVILTPVLRFANDSVELQPVVIAGRNAYLAHKRNDDLPASADLVRKKGEGISRSILVPWNPSMQRSELSFRTETRGCRCKSEGETSLADRFAFNLGPKFWDVIVPTDELASLEKNLKDLVKTRSVTKSAHVNYEVGKTVLLPNFADNPAELAAILATIDSVRNDKDLNVNSVNLHGYASPEGTYKLNTRLASGRAESLRKYISDHYNFGKALTAESTPEDWAGLREWVAASSLASKNEILKLIDSSLAPDAKDAALEEKFPNSYKILLWEVYPTLRRTDYRIDYTVCNFTTPEDIRKKIAENPDKLCYEEVMLVARTFPEGSADYEQLVLQSAEWFPADPRAQVHAALISLKNRDYSRADRHLQAVEKNASAVKNDKQFQSLYDYARGTLALNRQDYTTARPLLERAAAAGLPAARPALAFLSSAQ